MSQKYEYEFPILANVGEASEAQKVIDALNDSMALFGFHEKITLGSVEVATMSLKSKRPLTPEQIVKAKHVFTEELHKIPDLKNLTVGEPRIKNDIKTNS